MDFTCQVLHQRPVEGDEHQEPLSGFDLSTRWNYTEVNWLDKVQVCQINRTLSWIFTATTILVENLTRDLSSHL